MIQRDREDRLRTPHIDRKTQGKQYKKNVEKDISFEREKERTCFDCAAKEGIRTQNHVPNSNSLSMSSSFEAENVTLYLCFFLLLNMLLQLVKVRIYLSRKIWHLCRYIQSMLKVEIPFEVFFSCIYKEKLVFLKRKILGK